MIEYGRLQAQRELSKRHSPSERRNLAGLKLWLLFRAIICTTGPSSCRPGFGPSSWALRSGLHLPIPLWLGVYAEGFVVPSLLPPIVWHVHEMVFGFAAATVAGFLLTAIPNWTGRMPLQGVPLLILVSLWLIGRLTILLSAAVGAPIAAAADLSFPFVFLLVVAREIIAGKNWRNLPMLAALALLLIGNLLVHLEALRIADTTELGNRIGLVKMRPELARLPASPEGRFDLAVLAVTAFAFASWAAAPEMAITFGASLIAGIAMGVRLARWRGLKTPNEPLLFILRIGYGWLALGLVLLGLDALYPILPPTAARHALTVGAVRDHDARGDDTRFAGSHRASLDGRTPALRRFTPDHDRGYSTGAFTSRRRREGRRADASRHCLERRFRHFCCPLRKIARNPGAQGKAAKPIEARRL